MQAQDSLNKVNKVERVDFSAKIDSKQATKDGIYLNGYIVNMPYNKIKKLNGKTVRISGKVTIVKGTGHYNDGELRQGRDEDSKHILKPKIRL